MFAGVREHFTHSRRRIAHAAICTLAGAGLVAALGPMGASASAGQAAPPAKPSGATAAGHIVEAARAALHDPCPRSRDLHVGPTDGAFFSTVAPFEHFVSDRTQLFRYTCTLAEIAGPGPVSIAAREAPDNYTTPYIPVTRDRNQLYVYGYQPNPQTQGAYVASVNPVTLAQRWRMQIKVPPPGQWSYPGVLLAHGNGFLYAIYGNVLVKLDPATGQTVARRILPENPNGTGAAYNGMIVLPDGRIVAKGIERGPCKLSGTFGGLLCSVHNGLPTPVVVVDPTHLKILSVLKPPEPVTGRITAGQVGHTEYVYMAEHNTLVCYRYSHRDGTLHLDNRWGPVTYRTGRQTPGTGPGLLGNWLVVSSNFVPSRATMTITAANVHNSGRTFQIRPFAAATRRTGLSFSPSKAALDPATNNVYMDDTGGGELVGLHLNPRRGFSVMWRDRINSLDFVALAGLAAHPQLVFTDYKGGADHVVWIDGTTGHLLAESGPLAAKPAPANIVTPGFAGRFYYLGAQGQLWELHPVHVTR
jgi:hypothetical protein